MKVNGLQVLLNNEAD